MSAGQNGANLFKMAREEIGLQPRSKDILRHAHQDFDTISFEAFLFSSFFACREKPLFSQGRNLAALWKNLSILSRSLQ